MTRGSVGLTEAPARERGIPVRTGSTEIPGSARAGSTRPVTTGSSSRRRRRARCPARAPTSAGPAGGEVLGALAVAVHGQVPVPHLQNVIYAYPTFRRAIEDALRMANGRP
jgi:pyruvate/2-oxoglutarate dehydrogenase complex dihydrolipoamide dehydrogenase (E3) component